MSMISECELNDIIGHAGKTLQRKKLFNEVLLLHQKKSDKLVFFKILLCFLKLTLMLFCQLVVFKVSQMCVHCDMENY